ncbi:MAG: glucosaminidase domain-containing protein, partial [Schleiferiaceae bacterium]
MKVISLFIIHSFIICSSLFSQVSLSRTDYIEKYQKLAIREMKRSGIPASITLAQGILESGNGNSRLAKEAKNHFGIKC